ncbi:MAG: lysophospholipid acyltransferase family protein [Woeseiaceae bacterium]
MREKDSATDYSELDARLSPSSSRRRSLGRRLYYALGMPLLLALIKLLFRSYRVEAIIGSEVAERLIRTGTVCAPCHWHQHLVLGNMLLRSWLCRGLRAGFLISASVDGDVPARIAKSWGAEVTRGSANNTGALVLRDMHALFRRGVSVVSVPDGPNGPKGVFKAGVVLMARIAGVPLVPIACAADRAWYLKRWDDFMIPRPFARVVLAIGEPVSVPRNTPVDRLEEYRLTMQNALNALTEQSEDALGAIRR